MPVGIFAACHHLRRAGRLAPQDDELFGEVDNWFIARLPYPPFYADGNTIRAVPWFKPGATSLMAALAPLEDLLRRYDVPCDIVRSPDPGTIIYEDEFQIGVLPYARKDDAGETRRISAGNSEGAGNGAAEQREWNAAPRRESRDGNGAAIHPASPARANP
ncbi:hypothetical protein [Nonomuraea candida]|uniref:hypothetical protein n=1 Tax=Nonomuraea candida TaxID=359159 RepID=UPI0005B7E83A|nr:hypothetical protein [Nonomuraea candida]